MKLSWTIGDLRLAEEFDDPEAAVDRQRRSALAGEVAGLERLVRIQDQLFLAIFDTRR